MALQRICQSCYGVQPEGSTSSYCVMCQSENITSREAEEQQEDDLEFFSLEDSTYIVDESKPQYKVLTQKDRFFSAKFNPALIERALNEYAQDGWRMVSAVSADIPGLGSRNELIIFLEKLPNG